MSSANTSAAAYRYSTADGGRTYTRKLFGFEAAVLSYNEHGDGLFFYTGSVLFQLKDRQDRAALEAPVRTAWIALRQLAPQVGVRTRRAPGEHDWTVEYRVPASDAEADAWARETIVWHDEELSFAERSERLSDRSWMPSGDVPGIELHVSPVSVADGKWMFSLVGSHSLVDGRIAVSLHDRLLTALGAALATPHTPTPSFPWGAEVERLTGAAALYVANEETFERVAEQAMAATAPAPPPGFAPFLPPFIENPEPKVTTYMRHIVLDEAQTARLRANCKAHGRTVTQVIDALWSVADAEAILTLSRAHDDSHRAATEKVYEESNAWILALSFRDARPAMEGHTSLLGEKSTPLFSVDGYPVITGMDPIRNALGYDKASGAFAQELGPAFWDEVVPAYAAALTSVPRTAEGYISREAAKQAQLPAFSVEPIRARAFVSSSLGDVDSFDTPALGALKPGASDSSIHALDLLHRVRSNMPIMVTVYYQYLGRLEFGFHCAGKYLTPGEMDTCAAIYRKWLERLAV